MLKPLLHIFLIVLIANQTIAQNNTGLDYFIDQAKKNAPVLRGNVNLHKIGELQNNIIKAQNNAFQVNATSEVLIAPCFWHW